MNLIQQLHRFLQNKIENGASLLLALSGGADSLALLSLLLHVQKKLSFVLHIAHVDHGWRKESSEEAKLLEQIAAANNLPFHLKTLNPKDCRGNLEEYCRNERLCFFVRLGKEHQLHAVLLAHHADDQAETVLKRILEGASLAKLQGMREEMQYGGMMLWRPLLTVRKQQLIDWLKKEQLAPFDDTTNRDEHFLRARMRLRILPYLQQHFGKEVTSSLVQLGSAATEMDEYVRQQLQPKLAEVKKGPFGFYVSFEKTQTIFEIKTLIRLACEQEGMALPAQKMLQDIAQQIQSRACDKTFQQAGVAFFVDRGIFFCVQSELLKQPEDCCRLDLGSKEKKWSIWEIEYEIISNPNQQEEKSTDWHNLWRGTLTAFLPWRERYYLAVPQTNLFYPGKSAIRHFWNMYKVPAFLRLHAPLLYCNGHVIHEFLTGKTVHTSDEKMVKLTLRYKPNQITAMHITKE